MLLGYAILPGGVEPRTNRRHKADEPTYNGQSQGIGEEGPERSAMASCDLTPLQHYLEGELLALELQAIAINLQPPVFDRDLIHFPQSVTHPPSFLLLAVGEREGSDRHADILSAGIIITVLSTRFRLNAPFEGNCLVGRTDLTGDDVVQRLARLILWSLQVEPDEVVIVWRAGASGERLVSFDKVLGDRHPLVGAPWHRQVDGTTIITASFDEPHYGKPRDLATQVLEHFGCGKCLDHRPAPPDHPTQFEISRLRGKRKWPLSRRGER